MKVETEIYSRCSGYFRPVANWNKGKKEEFANRKKLVFDKNDLASGKELAEARS